MLHLVQEENKENTCEFDREKTNEVDRSFCNGNSLLKALLEELSKRKATGKPRTVLLGLDDG